ncbi:outer membrane protein assembly factor BamD [Bdellovibrio reynosensis]|uniref:Tetratricopeptide repeat protein n=1 Tax=Bdellovibrio reynosensis TaxID=2835041 RepID=A0ABY4C915_9BACT|nr:hypothetical protein [Bdellovibrio reynosensis]UOF01430.1 hypothetical protein MNR06_00495 [Bdellovibrio reynosensis]
MTVLVRFSLIVAIFFVVSCQSKEEPTSRKHQLSKGFVLLDQGRYSEAILYFENLAKKDPHFHVRLALASAYSARAQIDTKKLISVVALTEISLEKDFAKTNLEQSTVQVLQALEEFHTAWSMLPVLSGSARDDIRKALVVLKDDPKPSVRLYSAALRILQINGVIAEGLDQFTVLNTKKTCSKNLKPYFDWSLRIFDELIILTHDIELARPENHKACADARARLASIKNEALKVSWPKDNQCF